MNLGEARVSARGTLPSYFAEFCMALGPQSLGSAGDNTWRALYTRVWACVLTSERRLKLYQKSETGSVWTQQTTLLPGLFDQPQPESRRRFSIAFDQAARVLVAYEDNETVYLTRWSSSANEYVQNVTIAGVDPVVVMDGTFNDPRDYPSVEDDDWSVRDAYFAGINVFFKWLPESPPAWRDNVIPISDVLLFYLSPDRLSVMCRVQRELYATARTVYTFGSPAILDRVVALPGRYQLLVSDAVGVPRLEMLVSDPYVDDFMINPRQGDGVAVSAPPAPASVILNLYEDSTEYTLETTYELPPAAVTLQLYSAESSTSLARAFAMEPAVVTLQTLIAESGEELASDGSFLDALVVTSMELTEATHELSTEADLVAARVRTTA